MINVDKMSEGIDYELIPSSVQNEQAWWIRILRGPFVETVVSFGNIRVNGKEEQIHFNFTVVQTPIDGLDPKNQQLQDWCGSILHDVLDRHIASNSVVMTEVDSN